MPSGPDLILQHLRDSSHELARHTADLDPPLPFLHADLYLLSSLVQKAIRRGDLLVARRAGHQLYALDKQRLWRRLAVAALEADRRNCLRRDGCRIGRACILAGRAPPCLVATCVPWMWRSSMPAKPSRTGPAIISAPSLTESQWTEPIKLYWDRRRLTHCWPLWRHLVNPGRAVFAPQSWPVAELKGLHTFPIEPKLCWPPSVKLAFLNF